MKVTANTFSGTEQLSQIHRVFSHSLKGEMKSVFESDILLKPFQQFHYASEMETG